MVEERELNKYKVTELKQMLQEQGVTPKGMYKLTIKDYQRQLILIGFFCERRFESWPRAATVRSVEI